ncbi:putative nucleobase-ascorbate transporter 10 [Morella rubra]|uniref:Putative nucleobase-ascorbate transporter 10 n=1 Tax=Morella rubra TaxID=262757 RepID=A0A6A1V8X1_9ROSI|nr:putative nucleobase-ascorbate transporter 10 [Morella rubra]
MAVSIQFLPFRSHGHHLYRQGLMLYFRSTGTFFTTARYGSATHVPPSLISRGAGWLGIEVLVNGVFDSVTGTCASVENAGLPADKNWKSKSHPNISRGIEVLVNGVFDSVTGTCASVENAGLPASTRIGSRRAIQISAGFMILFSVLENLEHFASIPLPIVAALNCVFFGYVCLGFLQYCNLNSFRNKFVLGFSFFMGISVPQYFRESYHIGSSSAHVPTSSGWFDYIVTVIFMSHTTVASLVALILDCSLSRATDATRKETGLHWWMRFSLYSSYIRNDEFYELPFGLNKLFPAL